MTERDKAYRAMRMAWLRRECPALFRPGVVFTEDQKAAIRAMPQGQAVAAILAKVAP
jgi:hypothetical protein